MPSTKDAAGQAARVTEPFQAESSNAIVAFHVPTEGRQDHGSEHGKHSRRNLRTCFKACYNPPIVTLRLDVGVFSYGEKKKKKKTKLYFSIPLQHISSLGYVDHVDIATIPELDLDSSISKPAGGLACVRFILSRPGSLVQPRGECSLKPASQLTLTSMTLLATVLEFVLLIPRTTLSKEQIQRLQQAITLPTSQSHQQQREKEHNWWLRALYGGAGGKLFEPGPVAADKPKTVYNEGDVSTASESGDDSTIAVATPPAYKRSPSAGDPKDLAATVDKNSSVVVESSLAGEVAATSPPPYDFVESRDGPPDLAAGITGNQLGKRRRNSEQYDTKRPGRRLASETSLAISELMPPDLIRSLRPERDQDAVDLFDTPSSHYDLLDRVLMRLNDLEEENRSLRANISALQTSQTRTNAQLLETIDQNQDHLKRTKDLEIDCAQYGSCLDNLRQRHNGMDVRQTEMEDRQNEIEGRQSEFEEDRAEFNVRLEKTEEKCDTIELEIADQVRTALRDSLIGAVETI